jgi:hypothetical protein
MLRPSGSRIRTWATLACCSSSNYASGTGLVSGAVFGRIAGRVSAAAQGMLVSRQQSRGTNSRAGDRSTEPRMEHSGNTPRRMAVSSIGAGPSRVLFSRRHGFLEALDSQSRRTCGTLSCSCGGSTGIRRCRHDRQVPASPGLRRSGRPRAAVHRGQRIVLPRKVFVRSRVPSMRCGTQTDRRVSI